MNTNDKRAGDFLMRAGDMRRKRQAINMRTQPLPDGTGGPTTDPGINVNGAYNRAPHQDEQSLHPPLIEAPGAGPERGPWSSEMSDQPGPDAGSGDEGPRRVSKTPLQES